MKYLIMIAAVGVALSGCVLTDPANNQETSSYDAHKKATDENARRANAIQQKQYQQVLAQQRTFIQQTRAKHAAPSPPL